MQSRKIPQTKEGVCSLMLRQSFQFYVLYGVKNCVLHIDLSASVCDLVPATNLSYFYESHCKSSLQKLLNMHEFCDSYKLPEGQNEFLHFYL
jgi:hypothetical protein